MSVDKQCVCECVSDCVCVCVLLLLLLLGRGELWEAAVIFKTPCFLSRAEQCEKHDFRAEPQKHKNNRDEELHDVPFELMTSHQNTARPSFCSSLAKFNLFLFAGTQTFSARPPTPVPAMCFQTDEKQRYKLPRLNGSSIPFLISLVFR